MNSFNSFGQASDFGMPAPHGSDATSSMWPRANAGAGFVHFSTDPQRAQIYDQQIQGLTPQQLMDLAAHAVEKRNQGIPLTDQEVKALAAYQAYAHGQGQPQSAEQVAAAEVPYLEPEASTAQGLLTPKNIAIGIGILLAVSVLTGKK